MDIMNVDTKAKIKIKDLNNFELYGLGIDVKTFNEGTMVSKVEDLLKSPPMIVLGETLIDVRYRQNFHHREQSLLKRMNYVMALGVYQQLRFDPRTSTKILKPAKFKFKSVYKPYRGQDLTDKTLLVWRQGGIGDLLFISPNLRYIKEKYPTSKIIFGCGAQYQSMVKEWDFIDEIIDLPFPHTYLLTSQYHALFEGVIERTRQAENTNAYRLFSNWLGLDLPDEKLYPEQKPNPESLEKAKNILSTWNIEEKNFILVQLRASSPIRTPRQNIWIKIINALTDDNHKIIITDSPHKSKDVDMFIHKLKNKDKVFNFSTYSKELSDTIALASLSKYVIGVDSSLVHIAESVGVKNFSLFGPFPGEIRLSTYRFSEWVDAKSHCSPCFTHGQNLCNNSSGGYVRCFDNLNLEEIIERIKVNV